MQPNPPEIPSTRLDAAVCNLVDKIANFSDPDFDARWLHLTEPEVEELAVVIMDEWTTHLKGRKLAVVLLTIRQQS